MKTLVVDDETVSREKMSRIMRCFGPTTDAPDGIQAIKAFSDAWEKWDPFDLIMLDFSMKGMDGLQVLKTIRGLEKNKKLPPERQVKIMMVTSDADRETVLACVEAGCTEYILKPFNRETIKAKLVKWSPQYMAGV